MTHDLKYLDSHNKEPRLINIKEKGWSYYLNSLGYRDVPGNQWNVDDINSSILLLGCSQTFGQFINYEDTFGYRLQQQLGIRVINLALPAAGLEYMFLKTIQVLEKHTPLAIIYNYPTHERYINWSTQHSTSPLWQDKHGHLDKWIIENESQVLQKSKYFRRSINLMCKNKVPMLEITWCRQWNDSEAYFIKAIDKACDGNHWGPKTNQAVADQLIPMLQIKGIVD